MTYPRPRSLKRWRWGTPAWDRRIMANFRQPRNPAALLTWEQFAEYATPLPTYRCTIFSQNHTLQSAADGRPAMRLMPEFAPRLAQHVKTLMEEMEGDEYAGGDCRNREIEGLQQIDGDLVVSTIPGEKP